MNYERKYNEALERASKLKVQNPFDTVGQMVEHIFPELQESEEERIRKELIEFLKLPHSQFVGNREHEKWIAWLEKQREQKHTPIDIDKMVDKFAHTEVKGYGIPSLIEVDAYRKGINDAVKEARNVDEESDNVMQKQKFIVGDWIIFNGLVLLITEVVKDYYRTVSTSGIPNSYDWDIDRAARLWTIRDAKDGDVLADSDGSVFIFSNVKNGGCQFHIALGISGTIYTGVNGYSWETETAVLPATKEQRELLFKKMREDGTVWDSEEKQLKYIKKV